MVDYSRVDHSVKMQFFTLYWFGVTKYKEYFPTQSFHFQIELNILCIEIYQQTYKNYSGNINASPYSDLCLVYNDLTTFSSSMVHTECLL